MHKSRLAVFFIALGLLFFLVSMALLIHQLRPEERNTELLPRQLVGLPLQRAVYGVQAIDEIRRLHNSSLPLSDGAVGVYGKQGELQLWVSVADSEALAEQLVEEMEQKIAQGNSPFVPVADWEQRGTKIYALEGLGQLHYYFRTGTRVIWLAADAALAEDALADVLAYY